MHGTTNLKFLIAESEDSLHCET